MSSGAAVGLPRSVESTVVRTARHEADVEVAGPPSSTSSQRSDGLLVGLHA
ncbi:hypothetical protein V5D56_13965 [Cellulosimicrobium sp. PMB13]|uniref:hypothetical protein n=1 Tax=Cellulosimicrobium sp. PMB13 TaxID=3120158 RepID=UPI003F4C4011